MITVHYGNDCLVLRYDDQEIRLTPHGAAHTVTALRAVDRTSAFAFGGNIVLLDAEAAEAVACQLERAIVELGWHQAVVAEVDDAMNIDKTED